MFHSAKNETMRFVNKLKKTSNNIEGAAEKVYKSHIPVLLQ